MNKRGQFYLLASIVVVTLVLGFIAFSNTLQQKSKLNFNYIGDELKIESGNVIDYSVKNGKDVKSQLINFTESYSDYSEADNLYFIFGDTSQITVSGIKKTESGSIYVNAGSGNQAVLFDKGVYNSKDFSNPSSQINVTLNQSTYTFPVRTGENFYFIVSKEVNGDKYIITS